VYVFPLEVGPNKITVAFFPEIKSPTKGYISDS
jgi:hypothetical protein